MLTLSNEATTMPQPGSAEQDFVGDGPSDPAVNGVPTTSSLQKLVEIEEALSRLADMADLVCDLATSAQKGNEIMAGSLYFLSQSLLRDVVHLQGLCGGAPEDAKPASPACHSPA